jgi:hypothetical protein
MDIKIALEVISYLNTEFDSHDFIRKLLEKHPEVYGRYLVKHGDNGGSVATADGEIAKFLARHDNEHDNALHIIRIGNGRSRDILDNISDNAKWHK